MPELLENIYGHHSYTLRDAPQNYALVMTGEYSNRIKLNTVDTEQVLGVNKRFTYFARLTLVDVGRDILFLLYRGVGTEPRVDIAPNGSSVNYTDPYLNVLTTVALVPESPTYPESHLLIFSMYGYSKTGGGVESFISVSSQPFDIVSERVFTVAVTYAGSGLKTGMKVYINGERSIGPPTVSPVKSLNKTRPINQTDMLTHAWMVPPRAVSLESTVEKISLWTNVLSVKAVRKLHLNEVGMGSVSLGDELLGFFDMDDTGTGVEE